MDCKLRIEDFVLFLAGLLIPCTNRFDNLYPVQIASLLDSVMTSVPHEKVDTMDEVASCIAHTAHKSAKGTKNHTPFADAAKNAGYKYLGGKMDDITVITSFISGV
jgi:protein phosphatase PTC7